MKPILYLLAFCSIFVMVHSAAAATVRVPLLEAKLPTNVQVYCTDNTVTSWAQIDTKAVYIDQTDCGLLLHGHPGTVNEQYQQSWASAVVVLYHEWWHVAAHAYARGPDSVTVERQVECGARVSFRYMLRTYWGLSAKQAQAQYVNVWGSPYAPLPCEPNRRDPVL